MRRRNDRPPGRKAVTARPPWRDGSGEWLWGWHAVTAALENPARGGEMRLVATPERTRALAGRLSGSADVQVLAHGAIGDLLPPGAVHQGLALDAPPLDPAALVDLASPAEGVIVMLDQVTDPQNVGAIFRSAAAFGARGVVLQERHAPRLAGALAKAAAGAIDKIPHAREINLSRALERLEDLGWRAVGLDGQADADLADALDGGPTVLVLGSEGEGIRRLVREHCDALARIPVSDSIESLNVSAAAAIALYAALRAMTAKTGG
ncbi:MAG TPA: RNA methyltransferase [Caulobacteraceae bacterium]